MLVLLKTSKLVSEFENPPSGAENPSFSQQRERFLDNLGRSSTCNSLLTVGCIAMVFNAHFKSIATFLLKKLVQMQKKKKPLGQQKDNTERVTGICRLRTQRRSHYWPSTVETSGCEHTTFGFRGAPATAWMRWCVLASKGFPNPATATKSSPLPEQNDDLRLYRAKSVNGEGDPSRRHKLFERVVRWRRDMRGPIPYKTHGTVARPASGHSCRPTSLLWRTRRKAFFLPHIPVVSAAACNSAGPARCCTRHEQAIRARPSCCGFWNLVNAHAWNLRKRWGFLGDVMAAACKYYQRW